MKTRTILLISVPMALLFSCQPQGDQEKDTNGDASSGSATDPAKTASISKEIAWANRTAHSIRFEITDSTSDLDNKYSEVQYPADKKLVDILFDEVLKGNLKAYNSNFFPEKKELTLDEVNAIGHSIDTIAVEDPATHEMTMQVVESKLDRNNIEKFRLVQDWFYNSKTRKLETKIIAIGPVMASYDSEGNNRGDRVLFYVIF